MKSPVKKIELIANVAIITVALLLGVVLVGRNFLPQRVEHIARKSGNLNIGERVEVSGIDWKAREETLLVAMSKGCSACAESVPFYRRLLAELSTNERIRTVALLPQSVSESREYLDEAGIVVGDIKEVALDSIGVLIVPTLIAVDNAGRIHQTWVGKLATDQESEVVRYFQETDYPDSKNPSGDGGRDQLLEIDAAMLERLISSGQKTLVLDLDDRVQHARGHLPGSKNIPLDELEVRAANELPAGTRIVLYSRRFDEVGKIAQQILRTKGFPTVSVLRGGLNAWQKAGLPVASD